MADNHEAHQGLPEVPSPHATDTPNVPQEVKDVALSVYAQLLQLRRDGFDTFIVGPDGEAKTLRFPFDGPGYMPTPPKISDIPTKG